MGAYIGYLIRDGATKVEVTIPITCELNLKKNTGRIERRQSGTGERT